MITTSAVGEDNNTVTFRKPDSEGGGGLDEGPHSNCKISVTTSDNVTSDNLSVNSFVIDTIAPVLDNVTNVRNPINSLTPNYTFSSDEAVDNITGSYITYGGSCSSDNNTASVGNNTVTFNTLEDNKTYSDCTITLTDNATNASSALAVNTFTVDTTDPVLDLCHRWSCTYTGQ